MFVRKAALLLGLGGLLVSGTALVSSVAHASVSATAVTNGPIYYPSQGVKAINADGTAATKPSFIAGFTPVFSADYQKIAWISGTRTEMVIYVADTDGANKTSVFSITTTQGLLRSVDFSADKTQLIFSVNDTGQPAPGANKIYKVGASTANQTLSDATLVVSSSSGDIKDFAVSKDDNLAYITSAAQDCPYGGGPSFTGVFVRPLNTASPTFLTGSCSTSSNPAVKAELVRWNSAGDQVFVGHATAEPTSRTKISMISSDGSTETPITALANGIATGMAPSPDGTKLATLIMANDYSSATLSVMNIDGSNSSTVITFTGAGSGLSWGPPFVESNSKAPTTPTPTAAVVPGVTVTDTKIYTEAPKQVASNSAVAVMTREEAKTQTIVSNTPDVCLPSKDDIVFIDEGRCSASILDKKSGEVLRRFRTMVVEDEVSELKIGNEIATIAPIFFDGGSTDVNAKGMKRIRNLTSRITAAGNVLVVGHSGIALGDTPQNRQLSEDRAIATVKAMKKVGAKGPFVAIGIGGDDPLTRSTSGEDQDKNRRVVIILVP